MARVIPIVLGLLAPLIAGAAQAQSLRGSIVAMQRQHTVARQHDYTFLRTPAHVKRFIDLGLLVPVHANENVALGPVSFAYARPALRTFVYRLGAQYRAACGERLVITSLTRPLSSQPRNASDLSVHPAGMAVDLRVSRSAACRRWLERTLLSLEGRKLLDATRERFPAHYHVALFPEPYVRYVDRLTGASAARVAAAAAPASTAVAVTDAGQDAEWEQYRVGRGDSLWSIARRYGLTVDELKALNNLGSSRIDAGQFLTVPAATRQ